MALAVQSSATQAAVVGTEHQLAAPGGSNVYVLDVDVSAMQNGDVVEVRLKKPVLNGGTVNVVWRATVGPSARSESVLSSPPIACPFGCTVTLKQVAGTARNFPWSLMSLQ